MPRFKKIILISLSILAACAISACRGRSDAFAIALFERISTLDPLTATTVKAADERVRVLMFNSLVKKNEKFDYIPDLASSIQQSPDGLTYTFVLHENVKFHDGRSVTSADAKYSLDTLLESNAQKAAGFMESGNGVNQSYVSSVEAPDPLTLIVRLRKPWQPLLNNLVPVPVIPQGSVATQKDHPVGSGPYKFVRYDSSQSVLELVANDEYWEGAPSVKSIRIRAVEDGNALQAELKSGRVDIAPLPSNLTPDALISLGNERDLKVEKFPGANIVYLNLNTQSEPLNNVAVRQAVAYAIDRQKIVDQLLLGQAQVAHSVLPEGSWAYSPGQKYPYDPSKAKQLLDQAGFRDPDGDGPQLRFRKPIVYKISSASVAARQYAGVIQDYLKQVGIPLEIQTVEPTILIDQQKNGDFQLASGNWVGGNQDPIFLRDLFASSEIPSATHNGRNRSRYSNKEFDTIIDEAVSTIDREKALELYSRAQQIITRDVPMLPLWYPANMIVARKSVSNIHVDASGDWSFIRKLTVDSK
jgi:peptide/nickel transport system substrate-binding protein